MIDFHTHILPNLDDGARSIEETFNLLKEAKKAGFDGVVFTPHYIEKYYETDVAEREVWLDAISQNLRNKDVEIDTYLASELYFSKNMIKLLEDAKASTVNNTSYVLFELPLTTEPFDLYDVLYELQQNKLVPILAHPERYDFVQKEPELVYDLVQKGVLIQSNYGSILGQYGKKAQMILRKMLEHNLVHFLGSDVHRENSIYKDIPDALLDIQAIVGDEKLREMTYENPKLALNNKRIDIREPIEIKLTFKEKLLMNIANLKK